MLSFRNSMSFIAAALCRCRSSSRASNHHGGSGVIFGRGFQGGSEEKGDSKGVEEQRKQRRGALHEAGHSNLPK